ncbi:hypothetical protein NDA10_004652 [Ustilago hordei]|nr:hypothetical protein NDA10_004652 [Ustilago hordei]
MTDPDLNNKLDRLLTLLEAQLELTRQGHREERLQRAQLSREETMDSLTQKTKQEEEMIQSRDMEIFILEAEAWFKFNQVYEQSRMINHMEQFNPRNARMEAYNKLLALRLTSDAPGAATRHVERFRDLEGQVNLDDNELVIDLFRGSLTAAYRRSSRGIHLGRDGSGIERTGSRPNQSSIPIRQPTQTYPARSPSQATTQATIQNLNRPLPHHPTQPSKQGSPAPSGYGHHSRPLRGGHRLRRWPHRQH